jgi:hypothetical protein
LLFGLILLGVMLGLSVQSSHAKGMNCWVSVFPEKPTEFDEVGVVVNFLFYTDPPFVVDFGEVYRDDDTFSVNVTVHVPRKDEAVLQVVHNQSNAYALSRLEAGEYTFKVYVQTVHGSNEYWLEQEVKFTVSEEPAHTPEFPSNGYLLVLIALTSAAVILLKSSKKKPISLRRK